MKKELKKAAAQMKEAIRKHLYDSKLQRFIRGVYPNGQRDTTVDSSLCFIFLSETFEAQDEQVLKTMKALEDKLWIKNSVGGMARYENDEYYRVSKEVPGNPWVICTLWLARWYIAKATSKDDLDKALNLIAWAAKNASRTGMLAEQIDPYNGNPISVSPLSWSHAEFVICASEYAERLKKM